MLLVLVLLVNAACTARSQNPASTRSVPQIVFADSFDRPRAISRDWSVSVPEALGASVSFVDGSAQLTLQVTGEARLHRWLDVAPLRHQRIRLSARVRTDDAHADIHLALVTGGSGSSFRRSAQGGAKPAPAWTRIDTTLDVAPDDAHAEIELVFRGVGHAWFDDVQIEVIGPAPVVGSGTLSIGQRDRVAALVRAAALLRFRHPSDEVAMLDWDRFMPFAIDRVIQASADESLPQILDGLFATIAPTVEFSATATYSRGALPIEHGDHLARWRNHGAVSQGVYHAWREGRDADAASVYASTPLAIPDRVRCKKLRVTANVPVHRAYGATLYVQVEQPSREQAWFEHPIAPDEVMPAVDFELPPNALGLRVGVGLEGPSAAEIDRLVLSCDGREVKQLRAYEATWTYEGMTDLYARRLAECGNARCLSLQRVPAATAFDPARDLIREQIAPGLWLHVPLALWADDHRTFPAAVSWQPSPNGQPSDLGRRLSVIASAWGALWLFYPDFRDQGIDWQAALPGSLDDAAAARSLAETHRALAKLLAKLHDDHAVAKHPAFPIDGILPIAMRRFGAQLIVRGCEEPYRDAVPIGSEVVTIDGVPATTAFAEMQARVSAATRGWSEAMVPFWLTLGPTGTFSTLHIRHAGVEREVVLPHLPRTLYDERIREPRPTFGAEVAPGVYYVDLESMPIARWQASLPTLLQARALILDMRGAASTGVLSMLGHFIDQEVRSPEWQVPILESGQYETSSWTIRPIAPRISARLFLLIDARAVSISETVVQIVHDHHLATLVGEPSAGTNGDIETMALPEGFSMRFTGLRVLRGDGTPLQGHGFTPDVTVHPTLAGVRAGRDEILEAAIDLAKQ